MSGIVLAGDLGHIDIYEDNARSVEVVREEKDGKLGSFGFALVGVGPSRIGTVVPGKRSSFNVLSSVLLLFLGPLSFALMMSTSD